MNLPSRKTTAVLVCGIVAGLAFALAGFEAVHYSSTPEFCMSCHEMRIVGEQGWMKSAHFRNGRGIVAECRHCHVPPEDELFHMLWVKARDGSKDVFVHVMGESDPQKMDWDELAKSAREKVSQSSCVQCHANIGDRGMSIKAIQAHRKNGRLAAQGKGRLCLDCHQEEFHGGFRQGLENGAPAVARGD